MPELSQQLNPTQKNLVSVYQEKWKNIALTLNSRHGDRLEITIASIYNLIGLKKPQILFFESTSSALKTIATKPIHQLGKGIKDRRENKSIAVLQHILERQLNDELLGQIKSDR